MSAVQGQHSHQAQNKPLDRHDGHRLKRQFFARDAETVAREMLGAELHWQPVPGRLLRARVVETEAYVGVHDQACHASKGRTKRTEVMFGAAGHAYVYLVYGMHHMLNVVTGDRGDAQAVLIRAAEAMPPLAADLSGPGRLTRGMAIDLTANGADVTGPPLFFVAGQAPGRIVSTARVGVDYAGEWADAPLRYYDADSPDVSKP